jgi:hypothetical protein
MSFRLRNRPIPVTVPLPSRYRSVTVPLPFRYCFQASVTDHYIQLPTITDRCHTVSDRYPPLLTVTHRYHTVTHRYWPLQVTVSNGG